MTSNLPGTLGQLIRRSSACLTRIITDLLFPERCAICGLLLEPSNSPAWIQLCPQCRQKFDFADRPVCLRCGAFTTVMDEDAEDCSWCRRFELFFDRAICLGPYEEGLGRLILGLKRWPRPALVRALVRLLLVERKSRLLFGPPADVVVPVPQHWLSRLWSGIDPVGMIAEELASHLGLPYRPDGLRRKKFGPPQRGLGVRQRFDNVRSLYEIGTGQFRDMHVIAVDDVLTTGATLSAVAKVLKIAGAREVTAVAIARAEGELGP
ncbi:MAG: phosphoribosyltransferase family protein [Thermoguttaceae bacterium]|nr:phosphoribosyltransferase family protein [Thermoguttaceae bacterium]MDW8077557.1 phosphoribosyltransferase family protein [Thermoguttaceae bacterium]